jgi:hypothetical protein
MTNLEVLTTPTRLAPELFRVDVPEGWQQGRGAFGGLVLGNLVRAIAAFDAGDGGSDPPRSFTMGGDPPNPPPRAPVRAAPRTLRALTAELCAPVLPGPNDIRITLLRRGTGVATIAASVERDGEVLAHAVGVMGKQRATDADFCYLEPPAFPAWRSVERLHAEALGPSFAVHFEYRPIGALPFSGGNEATTSGWVRPVAPGALRDAAYVTSVVDAWWPAVFSRMTAPRPMATLTFALQLFDGLDGLDPVAPLAYRSRGLVARDGYIAEQRELFGEDGRFLALNLQTFVIIK